VQVETIMVRTVIRNSALCTKCNVEVESLSVDDPPVSCSCGNVRMAGGTSYTAPMVVDWNHYKPTIELCEKCLTLELELEFDEYEVCDCGKVHCGADKWD